MSLKRILLEFQDKNYLYHFTSFTNLGKILDSNTLKASSSWSTRKLSLKNKLATDLDRGLSSSDFKKGVSFTRNRILPRLGKRYISGTYGSLPVGLVFDRQVLKHKYKLYKFDVHAHTGQKDPNLLAEEIIFDDISNVRSLIEFVYIPKDYLGGSELLGLFLEDFAIMYKTYYRYVDFKYFDKGNFQDIEVKNPEPMDKKELMQKLYIEIFE